MKRKYPDVVISEKGKEFLRRGQTWMYRNNLVSADPGLQNGEPCNVVSENGEYLGSGFYSSVSHVVVRILTQNPDEMFDQAFFEKRVRKAWEYRLTVMHDNLTNCRVIFGEADALPGWTVDRYNDVLVSQISSYAMEMRKDMIYEVLLNVMRSSGQQITGIYERNDVKVREKDGLSLYKGAYREAVNTKQVIVENGLKLNVDIENGQKTGYFLDQKSNRVLVRYMAKGKTLLDCFTHTGGFALNAALGGAKEVTAVDVSQTALDEGLANAKLNGLEDRMKFVQADVFDYLDEIKPGQFDIIVLDPPAFTKNRRTVDHAYRGYKRINKRAMDVLKKNEGYLVTCSCSRYMESILFEQMLREAAEESGVVLQQISVTQQCADHPILWTMGETSYLKFYIFRIVKR